MRSPKIVGVLLSFFIAISIIYNGGRLISAPFFVLGLHWLSHNGGIEVSPNRKKYRRYHQYFWKRTGKWKPFKPYRAVLYLPGQGSKVVPGPHFSMPLKHRDVYYDIYLADKSHRKKLFLRSYHGKEKAWNYAQWVSEELKKPIEEYSPNVSKSTKQRRKKRRKRKWK